MNIAIFLPNWLGDVVMATPTVRAIWRKYGRQARIVGIMRPYLADILRGTKWLDEQWHFDPRSGKPELGPRALVRRMRATRFDMALLLGNSFRTALLAWRGGATERVGVVRDCRGPLLTGKVYRPSRRGRPVEVPMVDHCLRIAAAVGCPPESQRLELATLEEDERSAEAVWAKLGVRSADRVITFNSSGAYGAAKLWPPEHFGQLARRVATELDHDILVMCGPKEKAIAREIVRRADHPRVFSMADQALDLGTAKACIRRGRLMVSTDSGPRHVAAAFGKPVITLYGPILPVTSENPTQKAVNLMLPLDCVGCKGRVCPKKHHRCMRDLSPDLVYKEVVNLLDKDRRTWAA